MAARVKKYTNKICMHMDNYIVCVCVHIMAVLLLNGLKFFLDDIVCAHMASCSMTT